MKFDAEAAYAAESPEQEGQPQEQQGAPLEIPAEQVAQLQQLKAAGDMQALGQFVAQLLG